MPEKFTIKYFDMGQGDCILVVCPDGKLVMIDCGSSKGLGANSKTLLKVCTGLRKFTSKNNRKIDILILTHRDRDHYNQVKNVFEKRTFLDKKTPPLHKINIGKVYFSSPPAPSNAYALTQFTENSCGHLITTKARFKTSEVSQVFINDKVQEVVTYDQDNNFQLIHGMTDPINNYRLTLLSGKTPKGKDWSVSIIAGHVPETRKPSKAIPEADATNALSLVTLLKVGSTKALFLGDATQATEGFLMRRQAAAIKDVDFVHIPHHGSRTSSGKNFVKAVNPNAAEVTHEPFETGFKLPKGDVLKRWLRILQYKEQMDKHAVDYWMEIDEDKYEEVFEYWQKNHYNLDVRFRTIYMLRIPKGYANNFIALNKATTAYWGLYRSRTGSQLCSTGADIFNTWSIP